MGTRSYLIGQGYQNLRKHTSKTFSTMFVICATMILLGLFIIVLVNIQANIKTVAEQQGMQAFIKDDVEETDIESIAKNIQGVANVKSIKYLDKESALEDAKNTLGSYSYLLKGLEISNPFPRSFVITFQKLADSSKVKASVETIDGIYNVKYNADIINAVETISSIATFVTFGIGAVMVVISVFIISNTIKLAVYSNKREIYIMKYIGATCNFIKAPFIVEGILMGLGASLLSWVTISLGYVAAYARLPKVGSSLGVFGFVAYSNFWYYILAFFVLLGIMLGGMGSAIATNKYLADFNADKSCKPKKDNKRNLKQNPEGKDENKENPDDIKKNKIEEDNINNRRRQRTKLKAIILLLSAITLLTTSNIYGTSTIDDIKDDIKDLENKNKTILQQYADIKDDIDIYNGDIETLDTKIEGYTDDIDKLNIRVSAIEEEVNTINIRLQEASVDYQATQDLLNTRLRVLYEQGFVSLWQMLFTSHSITDFIAKYNIIVALINNDQQLLNSMSNQKEYINSIQKDVALRQAQITQVQYDVQKSKEALEGAKATKVAKLKQLEVSKAELAKLKKSVQSQIAAMNRKLEEEIAKSKNYNASFSGDFAWPVPGIYLITAMFHDGEYYSYYGLHTGVDIAKSSGPTVVAAQAGKVVTCKYSGSYGNLIIISHGKDKKTGKEIKTVYAHLASFKVSLNQIVTKGQAIGRMGTTGNSTGVHLHFELRVNGVATDPILHFKGMSLSYMTGRKIIAYPWANLSTYQR